MKPRDRLIVALDFGSARDAMDLVDLLAGEVGWFKIGLELMMAAGPVPMIKQIHDAGAKIFVDGKFNDIPNTVAAATRVVCEAGADMVDVHASAGPRGIAAAAGQKNDALLMAVTVLTSFTDGDTKEVFGHTPSEQVSRFAGLAAENGADGVVCSPAEAAVLRSNTATQALLRVVPGVRPDWAEAGDQRRLATPATAVRNGADYLVIGRPITQPPASVGGQLAAVRLVLDEIEQA